MSELLQGLGIIFHSDNLDRVNHGLSIAVVAAALGRDVILFFAYGALGYLKADNMSKTLRKSNGVEIKQTEELLELIIQAKKWVHIFMRVQDQWVH